MHILITSTAWSGTAARLAFALHQLGARVSGLCPQGNPMMVTLAVGKVCRYRSILSHACILQAIQETSPDLIVPCDELALTHLHELHARSARDNIRPNAMGDLIERSLGRPASFPVVHSRQQITSLAKSLGILVPASQAMPDLAALDSWAKVQPFPWVLKSDGTSAGTGVRIVSTLAEARTVWRELSAQPTLFRATKRLLVAHDPFLAQVYVKYRRPRISAQAFIEGTAANCSTAAWRGETLAAFSVAVQLTATATSPAVIVRLTENESMLHAANLLNWRLGLTGFCIYDFVIERGTGAAYLLELNPRTGQLSHLQLGPGRDLTAAFYSRLSGMPVDRAAQHATGDTLAIFPAALHHCPAPATFAANTLDVPWGEPELIDDLLKANWTQRGLAYRILNHLRSMVKARTLRPPVTHKKLVLPPGAVPQRPAA